MTKPVNPEDYSIKEGDCFGQMWNGSVSECAICADCELCGIVFRKTVDERAKMLQSQQGTKFLDATDFTLINPMMMNKWLDKSERTVADLFDRIMEQASTSDEVAVKAYFRQFLSEHGWTTKNGVVVKKSK